MPVAYGGGGGGDGDGVGVEAGARAGVEEVQGSELSLFTDPVSQVVSGFPLSLPGGSIGVPGSESGPDGGLAVKPTRI